MLRKPKMIVAVDIETSGPSVLRNGILAIGFCLGDMKGSVIQKKRIHVALDDHHTFDERCLTDFWDKPANKKVLETIQVNTSPPAKAIREFVQAIDTFDEHYQVSLVSDNPTFDFYFLNYYLDYYLKRKPLNYMFGEIYRSLIDSKSFLRRYLGCNYRKSMQLKFHGVKHDHFPENDAEYIYLCYYSHYFR